MPARKPPHDEPTVVTPDNPAEYQRFLDMAREVEADETPGALDRAFEKVIGSPGAHQNHDNVKLPPVARTPSRKRSKG